MESSLSGATIRRSPGADAASGLALAFAILMLGACAGAPAPKSAPDEVSAQPPAAKAEPVAPSEPEPAPATEPKSMPEALAELYAGAENGEAAGSNEEEKKGGAGIAYPEPPDGKWLVDDQGRQYFVEEIPKIEGKYLRTGENQIRLLHGYVLDLDGETDDTFLVKIYKAEATPPKQEGPTPEQVAEVEASYRAETPIVRKLTFQPFDQGLPRQAQWRNGFDVADMNGDGHPDILHGPPRRGFASRPFIFLGDGAGGWRTWEEAVFPPAPYDYGDAEAADFNGDGKMDLALGVHLGGLAVLTGDGNGRFNRWDEGLKLVAAGAVAPDLFTSRTLGSTDWDGDGRPDLVAVSEGPRDPKAMETEGVQSLSGVAVFHNQGDGTWTEVERLGIAKDLFGDAVTVGDFDGDGRPDLAIGSNVMGVRELVFLNRPDGVQAVEAEAMRPLSLVWTVDSADFNGDGLSDLAVASTAYRSQAWWAAVDVLLARKGQDGAVSFERRTLAGGPDAPELRVFALGTGDVDGNGDADLVTATAEGVVSVYLGDGNGGFVREQQDLTEAAPGCRGYHVMLADLDGDGADEIVVGLAGEKCPEGGSLRVWKAIRK
jgi:hypothetical protein